MHTANYLTDPALLQKRILNLHLKRGKGRLDKPRVKKLTEKQRKIIHLKTNGRCHFCGIKVPVNNFQADHVVCHVRGGEHVEDNYLPSCFICNNYRWHYLTRELQIILKMGVWARTQVEHQTMIGLDIANKFSKKESSRIKRNDK